MVSREVKGMTTRNKRKSINQSIKFSQINDDDVP